MKKLFRISLLFVTSTLIGCINNYHIEHHYYGYAAYHPQSAYAPYDAAPREGWATDPILSYNLFSYYPYDFYHGGFYAH